MDVYIRCSLVAMSVGGMTYHVAHTTKGVQRPQQRDDDVKLLQQVRRCVYGKSKANACSMALSRNNTPVMYTRYEHP
jgi:hypothetical protein